MGNKKKKREAIRLSGVNGKSYVMDINTGQVLGIKNYVAVLLADCDSSVCRKIVATPSTADRIVIVTSGQKIKSILTVNDKANKSNEEKQDVNESFRGILFLIWTGQNADNNEKHLLFADSTQKVFRNICLESFGYADEVVLEVMEKLLPVAVGNQNSSAVLGSIATPLLTSSGSEE